MAKDLGQFAATSSYNVFYSRTCVLHIYKLRKIFSPSVKVLIFRIRVGLHFHYIEDKHSYCVKRMRMFYSKSEITYVTEGKFVSILQETINVSIKNGESGTV